MADGKVIACRDCLYHDGDGIMRCYHPQAKSYDRIGEPRWARCDDMRDFRGACSDGQLFEAPVPMSAEQKIIRAGVIGGLLLVAAVACHAF